VSTPEDAREDAAELVDARARREARPTSQGTPARSRVAGDEDEVTPDDVPHRAHLVALLPFSPEMFVQYDDGLYQMRARGKDGKRARSLLIRGQLTIEAAYQPRTVESDGTPGEAAPDEFYAVRFDNVPGEPHPLRALVSSRDLRKSRDPDWPDTTKTVRHVGPRKLPFLAQAIRAAVQAARMAGTVIEDRFDSTGPLRRDGLPLAFLDPSGPAITGQGVDESARCELPADIGRTAGVRMLGVDTPVADTLAEDMAALLSIADVEPGNPAIPLTLLSQLVTAPLVGVMDRAITLSLIYGPTNQLKSAMCRLVLQPQSTTASGRDLPITVNLRPGGSTTTNYAAETVVHSLGGFLPVLDDIIVSGLGAQMLDKRIGFLSSYASHAVEGAGALRGHWGTELRIKSGAPRASSVFTGESAGDQERQASTLSRMVVLKHPGADAVDVALLTRLQSPESARRTSRAWGHLVRWLYADPARVEPAYVRAAAIVDGWGLSGDVFLRSAEMYTRIVAGLVILAEVAEDVGLNVFGWLDARTPHLRAALVEQAGRMGTQAGGASHLSVPETVREALRDGLARRHLFLHGELASPKHRHPVPELPEGFGPSDAGWEPENSGMVADQWTPAPRSMPIGPIVGPATGAGRPGRFPWVLRVRASQDWPQLYRMIRRYADEKGVPLESARDTLRELEQAGHVVLGAQPNGASVRSHLFDLRWLLGCDDDTDDTAPEDEPSNTPPPTPTPSAPTPPAQGSPAPAAPAAPDDTEDTAPGDGPANTPAPTQPTQGAPAPAPPVVCPACSATGPWCGFGATATTEAPCVLCGKLTCLRSACGAARHGNCHTPDAAAGESRTATPAPAKAPAPAPAKAKAARARVGESLSAPYVVAHLDGLHYPGGRVDPLPDTTSAAGLLDVARSLTTGPHDVGQVWITRALAERVGLPVREPGRGDPYPAWFKDAREAGWTLPDDRPGSWVTGWRTDADASRSALVIPHYGTAWPADDPARLLAGLDAYRETVGMPYRSSSGRTGTDLMMAMHTVKGGTWLDKPGEHPAPACSARLCGESDFRWVRPLTTEEAALPYVHAYDANAAYLSGAQSLPCPVGAPVHVESPAFDPRKGGYWRVPGLSGTDRLLPDPFRPGGSKAGDWWTTETLRLAAEDLGMQVAPVEAWLYPGTTRYLTPWANRLRDAREALSTRAAGGEVAAADALAVVKQTYAFGIGFLDGGWHDGDLMHRPAWRHGVIARARANLYRRLVAAAGGPGGFGPRPFAVDVDCAYYASDIADPALACPLPFGTGLGKFKHAGTADCADVAEAVGAGTKRPRPKALVAVRDLMKGGE